MYMIGIISKTIYLFTNAFGEDTLYRNCKSLYLQKACRLLLEQINGVFDVVSGGEINIVISKINIQNTIWFAILDH